MARTAAQNEMMREKRKSQIIARSARLFSTLGFDALTVDDITAAAGCAHGLFYHYFATMEDLYNAVVDCYETQYAERVLSWEQMEGVAAPEALRMVCESYRRLCQEKDPLVHYARLTLLKGSQTRKAVSPLRGADFEKMAAAIIRRGQQTGALKSGDTADMARLLSALLLNETRLRLSLGQEKYRPLDVGFILSLFAAERKH